MEQQEKRIWYKEKTYKFTMIGLFILMTFFSAGTWILDGEIRELGAVYLFGGGMCLTTILAFLFRKNP